MHDKSKSVEMVERLLRSIQKAIKTKVVTSKDPHAEAIASIQKKLVPMLNKLDSKAETVHFKINADELPKFVQIAGGERVFSSIALIKSFITMQGRKVSIERMVRLSDRMTGFLKSAKAKSDPFTALVKDLQKELGKAIKTGGELDFQSYALSGLLAGLEEHESLNGLGCSSCDSGTLNGTVSGADMLEYQYETLNLTWPWSQLLGQPAKGFNVMLWGNPGGGKSTLALGLARDLARTSGKTLYVSGEEFGSYTLQDKLRRAGGHVEGLYFSEDYAGQDLGAWDFVVLDSVQKLRLSYEDFEALNAAYPNTTFVLIFQATKDQKFKGVKEWEHEVDVVVEIENGTARTSKNRYAPQAEISIF
jgi:nucleoside-triphosphatase THEP1